MPYARFYKLPVEKREQLLDVAAREFARYGFEDASINRILELAQVSKGAAYYYFEDKVDVFVTVVQYAMERLRLIEQDVDIALLTAESFWPTFAELHRQPLLRSFEQPWLFAALRAAGRLTPETRERKQLAELAGKLMSWVMVIIQRGQELGVIRADIEDELIFGWLQALDGASDQWLLAHWESLDRQAILRISDVTVEAMRLAVSPPNLHDDERGALS